MLHGAASAEPIYSKKRGNDQCRVPVFKQSEVDLSHERRYLAFATGSSDTSPLESVLSTSNAFHQEQHLPLASNLSMSVPYDKLAVMSPRLTGGTDNDGGPCPGGLYR